MKSSCRNLKIGKNDIQGVPKKSWSQFDIKYFKNY